MVEVINTDIFIEGVDLLKSNEFGKYRFEPGITGLKIRYNGKLFIYMPTDATVKNHLTLKQVLSYLARKMSINLPKATTLSNIFKVFNHEN